MKEFAWFLGNVVKVNFSILGVLPKRITEKYFPYFLTLISVGGGGGGDFTPPTPPPQLAFP